MRAGSTTSAVDAVPPILDTRLRVPAIDPDTVIERRRLSEHATPGTGPTLTLVTAPAGYGKTTVLAVQAANSRDPVAWYTAEPRDNHPGRFLELVVAALRALPGDVATPPDATVPFGGISAEAIAQRAGIAMDAIDRPFTLVIDDFHFLDDAAIVDAVRLLVEFPPPNLSLWIGSRSEPALPLSRWRVQGKLAELRADDLRFTHEEIVHLCERWLPSRLTGQDIERLHHGTDGWAAALRLSLLQLNQASDHEVQEMLRRLSGNTAYVLDYLDDELLTNLPDERRSFLERTSILRRLSEDLCAAVTGEPVSPGMLRDLMRSGVLMTALDDAGQWYRYHPILAAVLHRRLTASTPPDDIRELHRRASTWWEAYGDHEIAVDQAILAEDWPRATMLMRPMLAEFEARGQLARWRSWFDAFPVATVEQSAEFSYWYALTLVQTCQMDAIDQHLRNAERLWSSQGNTAMIAAATTVRAVDAFHRGDSDTCLRLATEALTSLPAEMVVERTRATICLGIAYSHLGQSAAAREVLEAVTEGDSADASILLDAQVALGWVDIMQGRLGDARNRLTNLIATHASVVSDAIRRACSLLATVHAEQGNDAEAERLLRLADERAHRYGYYPLLADARWRWALIRYRRGEDAQALAALDALVADAQIVNNPTVLARTRSLKARIWMRQGHAARVERWADRLIPVQTEAITYIRQAEYATLAQWQIQRGQAETALAVATTLCDLAEQDGRTDDLIRFLVLRAIAADATGDRDRALLAAERALELGEPGGYLISLAGGGEPFRHLLRQIAAGGACIEYVARIDTVARTNFATPPDAKAAPDQSGPVALSDREMEVLRLIAIGLSNREISGQLYISVPTVKRHLTNVFGKLDVANRTEAVHRARTSRIL